MSNKSAFILFFTFIMIFLLINEAFKMHGGFVFIPLSVILGFFTGLLFYEPLFKLISEDSDEHTFIPRKRTREMIFMVAFGVSGLLIFSGNKLFLQFSTTHSSAILNKSRIYSRTKTCYEIKLKDNSKHCVDKSCFDNRKPGDIVLINSKTGLFGLKKLYVSCLN